MELVQLQPISISYAITVCNEHVEIQRLIPFLLKHKKPQDNIVVLWDYLNGSKEVEEYLRTHGVNNEFAWYSGPFRKDFAEWKNQLTHYCNGNYIFQIDADEVPSEHLMEHIHDVLFANPQSDVLLVPRVNTVEGITQEHIQKWGWRQDNNGWINFPDYQWRIYKNNNKIKWKNKVHEILDNYEKFSYLPPNEEFVLYHPKDIQKQVKQNQLYNTI
jgi:hypothetical protein